MIKRFLAAFYPNIPFDEDHLEYRKAILFRYFLICSFIILALFIPFNIFVSGNIVIATGEACLLAILLVVNLYLMPTERGYAKAIWVFPIITGIWSVFITLFGIIDNYALIWNLLFMAMLFFFLGQKIGARVSTVYFFWVFSYLWSQTPERLSIEGLTNIVACTFFMFLVFNFYEDTRANAEKKLRKLLTIDELTNLYNRRHIDTILAHEISAADRYEQPLSIILLDVDHFKQINDTHGHPVGDHVLKVISKTLNESVRSADHVGRWGGEEFMIVAPQTDSQNAKILAEKLRFAIGAANFDGGIRCSASFGVTDFRSEESKKALVARADEALYQAKNSGRNCVESL